MKRKNKKQDAATGVVPQPIQLTFFGGVLFFLILVIGAVILPDYSQAYLYSSIPVGLFGFGSHLWLNLKPNLYARFFLNVCISILCVMIACRSFGNLLPRLAYLGAGFIILIVVFFHTLPMWNSKLANSIRTELQAPKTKLGKGIYGIALFLGPFIGGLSLLIGRHPGDNKSSGLSLILLTVFLFIAVVLPFGYRFPGSPWERNVYEK
jgi:hypothetical protein